MVGREGPRPTGRGEGVHRLRLRAAAGGFPDMSATASKQGRIARDGGNPAYLVEGQGALVLPDVPGDLDGGLVCLHLHADLDDVEWLAWRSSMLSEV